MCVSLVRSEVTRGKGNKYQVIIDANKGLSHPLPICLDVYRAHILVKFLNSSPHKRDAVLICTMEPTSLELVLDHVDLGYNHSLSFFIIRRLRSRELCSL